MLQPTQGVGYGPADGMCGVYALAERELAIPFALSYRPVKSGAVFSVDTSRRPPRIILKDTEVEWDRPGYLYTVEADLFRRIDGEQWLSEAPVVPVNIEEIAPELFRAWVEYVVSG